MNLLQLILLLVLFSVSLTNKCKIFSCPSLHVELKSSLCVQRGQTDPTVWDAQSCTDEEYCQTSGWDHPGRAGNFATCGSGSPKKFPEVFVTGLENGVDGDH